MVNDYTVKVIELNNAEGDIISEIVEILRSAFNTSDLFDEEWFRWKHVESPYGSSLCWCVFYKGNIVAVRLYSIWCNDEKYIQAVDTATDKNHQRKGLFKMLINESLQHISDRNMVIFNFPNSNSCPQYLKYGWKIKEKLALGTAIIPRYNNKSVSDYLSDRHTKSFIDWRLDVRSKQCYLKFLTPNSKVIFKSNESFCNYYHLVYLNLNKKDTSELISFMIKNKIFIVRYLADNMIVSRFVNENFFFKIKGKKKVNLLTRGGDIPLNNVQLLDMDFM
nr:hypothetical protein BCU38_17090 [Vibrio splendidus]